MTDTTRELSQLGKDVLEGLSKPQKSLPSKYFYDKKGDELFVKIMHMPEYYLTDAEMDIFTNQTEALGNALGFPQPFDLIELGAGNGEKTIRLLKYLHEELRLDFTYVPVDISRNALSGLTAHLEKELPDLRVRGVAGEYLEALDLADSGDKPKSILFLGSNIGNLRDENANTFIRSLDHHLNDGD